MFLNPLTYLGFGKVVFGCKPLTLLSLFVISQPCDSITMAGDGVLTQCLDLDLEYEVKPITPFVPIHAQFCEPTSAVGGGTLCVLGKSAYPHLAQPVESFPQTELDSQESE